MIAILQILCLAGGMLSLATGALALRSWLSFRRVRRDLQREALAHVDDLSIRAGELQERASGLEARLTELPVRLHELQSHLRTLGALANILGETLGGARRLLTLPARLRRNA